MTVERLRPRPRGGIGSLGGLVLGGALTVLASTAQAGAPQGDAEAGRRAFDRQCAFCHGLAENRFGPSLGGVYGRGVAQAPGFRYSRALSQQSFRWSEATLDTWLQGPRKMVPGAAMPITIGDPRQRADIIAYLKRQSHGS